MKTDNTDDLSQLEQLDNTITLKVLKTRYEKDIIYTNCGDILIALNPCKELPIFGENEHNRYDWQNFSEIPAPHVFNTAARAFQRMRESQTDQVIIVSGESGAGKTESTKFMVKHFVHMCRSENKELHEKIIKVNPLLEAFGNAKTHMNHNSSRFAKYLELSFSAKCDLTGVIIRDYMLEKSRVVHRSANEGNFHAFYSLFHGASKETLEALSLEKHIGSYRIMQSDPNSLVAEARYKQMYREQNKVLQQIQTDPQLVDSLLAAIIHLTEVKFIESPKMAGAADLLDVAPIVNVSELLCLKAEDLIEALVSTKMKMRGDEIRRNKGLQQAAEGRDALAKMLYERTFQWLVRQINDDLHPNRRGFEQLLSTSILDIAGFEKLPVNSLEQLCINIVNEKLQNFMNERLFRFELQAYTDEGINVGNVAFENNDVLIDFLTKPRNSVLALLDEQSSLQHGSDIAFVRLLTDIYKDAGIYIPPLANRPEFTVKHFAGKVTYNAAGFMEKNRDLLNPELKDCIKSSQDEFISDLFTVKRGPTGTISATVYNYGKSRREMGVRVLPAGASKREQQLANLRQSLAAFFIRKEQASAAGGGLQQIATNRQHKTIVSHFKSSLQNLLDKMSRAEHFFVRCLKPNEDLRQNDFTDDVVSKQLKYNGISEMAKIRKMGFTYRRTHEEFVQRYSEAWSDSVQVQENCHEAVATDILKSVNIPAELQKDCRIGKTKVFMRERLVTWMEGVLYKVHKKKEEEREKERKRKEKEELLRQDNEKRRECEKEQLIKEDELGTSSQKDEQPMLGTPSQKDEQRNLGTSSQKGEQRKLITSSQKDEQRNLGTSSQKDEQRNLGTSSQKDEQRKLGTSSQKDEQRNLGTSSQKDEQRNLGTSSQKDEQRNLGTSSQNDEQRNFGTSSQKDEQRNFGTSSQKHEQRNWGTSSPKDEQRNLGTSSQKDEQRKLGTSSQNDEQRNLGTSIQKDEQRNLGTSRQKDEQRNLGKSSQKDEQGNLGTSCQKDEQLKLGTSSQKDEQRNLGTSSQKDEQRNLGTSRQKDEQSNLGTSSQKDEQSNLGTSSQKDEQRNLGTSSQKDEQRNLGTSSQKDEQRNLGKSSQKDEQGNLGTSCQKDEQRNLGTSSQNDEQRNLGTSRQKDEQRNLGTQQKKKWTTGEPIGSGGFGRVYQALLAEVQDEQCAVKQIAFCKSNEIRKVMDSLKKDVKMLKGLEHERIAKYYGFAEENYVFSIFLEYAPNRSVEDYLKSKGALKDKHALELVRQVLGGLAFLHARNIVHRDLKASNILLDDKMNTKLCDIGLSTTLETHTFASRGCTTSVGCSFWSSPEVVKGKKYNEKTDIWSLGCTIIELVTAQRPWYPHPPYTALLRIGCDLSPLDAAQEQFTVSVVMKNFLDPIFQVKKKKRPSAQDLMSHSLYSV